MNRNSKDALNLAEEAKKRAEKEFQVMLLIVLKEFQVVLLIVLKEFQVVLLLVLVAFSSGFFSTHFLALSKFCICKINKCF